MPRKKKKTYGSDLPPLQFVESPLDQSPCYPSSPDFGPVNPVTARLVAIEDLNDPTWVTPHFGHITPHCADQSAKRMTRLARLQQRSECHKHSCTQDVARKYKPLSFVHNRKDALTESTALHSVPISGTTSGNLHRQSKERVGRKRSDKNQKALWENESLEEFPPHSFRISTPIITGERLKGSCSRTSFSPLCSPVMTDNTNGNDFQILQIGGGRLDGKIHLTGEEDCDEQKENSKSDDVADGLERSAVFGRKTRQTATSLFGFSPSTPPPSPMSSPACSVLAADTPESEYGLTMRQRQLKYFLRSRQQRR